MMGESINLNAEMFDSRNNLIKDIHQFANNQEVKVTIKLTDAQIARLDTSKLSMYYYDKATDEWVELGGSFDPSTTEFTFYTPNFANFDLAGNFKPKATV